jgi:hypothetical protein
MEARDTRHGFERECASIALAKARHACAVAFGKRYGWSPSYKTFPIEEICPREVRRARGRWGLTVPWLALDHSTCYRRNGRPVAITSQPYAKAIKLAEWESFADAHGLRVEVYGSDDAPSWYFPNMCSIVVWRRRY